MNQRFFDILFSGSAILLIFPLMIPIILILRLTGEGEIFFLQKRVGKNGRLFNLFKFATMLKNSPNVGTGTVTLKNDPRILPIGNILRKSKINELPQLFNIFKGDMSVVGPRPQSSRNFSAYSEDTQKTIMLVSPGLTGLGSIFFSNEEAMLTSDVNHDEFYASVIMSYKGQLEVWYVDHRTIVVDLKIIYATAIKIIFPALRLNLSKLFDGIPNPPKALQSFWRS